MKFYETHYEDYIAAIDQYNLHPELDLVINNFPPKISKFGNLIVYGPSGVGKYSQVLKILKKYSISELKYEKKITVQTDKQQYIYHISDIHYEIDMSLLGCNSKILWHEIFLQIVDIVSVKHEKIGIIVCKNFHTIHNELLEIFYSYMQQYNHPQLNIQIKFILITEHVSFLPNSIINHCITIPIKRPTKDAYLEMIRISQNVRLLPSYRENVDASSGSNNNNNNITTQFVAKISNPKQYNPRNENIKMCINSIDMKGIINTKEIRSFSHIQSLSELPKDVFNIICDAIIKEMLNPKTIVISEFRDIIYDILIYNLDAIECVWHIFSYFIFINAIQQSDVSEIMTKIHRFLKYYNNNYRPIYHLESILFYFITKIHHY